MPPAIRTEALTRSYGPVLALDHLDLEVEQGEIFGFLGPNGAGKSTTIRILLDLIRPDSGLAEVRGFDCQRQSVEARRQCGYLAGEFRSWPGLTGRATVELLATMRGDDTDIAALNTFADRMRLELDRKVGEYSKGNRQKLGVLLALLGSPRVLLLDEPTSGLDPILQHEVHAILKEQAAAGVTVFFSSHVMSEVEQICHRVGILRRGRLIAVDEIEDLKSKGIRHVTVSFGGPPPPDLDVPGMRILHRNAQTVEFEVAGEIDPLVKALALHHIVDLETSQPTLDEILLSYYEETSA